MAGGMTVTVKGDRELAKLLFELPAELRRNVMRDAIRPAADLVYNAIHPRIPVRTGKLKASLETRETQIRGEPSAVVLFSRKGGKVGRRAHFTEYGTVHVRAQPAFVPGVEASEAEAARTVEERVTAAIFAYWESQGGRA
jgi:HK97 gp10 family phage protein